ncbi:MAG: hypothetical protein CL406_00770 [Acidimicrobiaceae bacterium]|nr:hypothetical protein [Acidimicrobiaceae bacterium]MDP6481746.1 LysM peptidoglycan-binding domain-containing protein [Acidimicrobiales bacterium]MDP6697571.1 LysM peptidoglycan-binding domain-containing protein [Acidimicrobiales bacterium]
MRVILAIAALIAVTASACGGTDEVVTPATTPDLFGNSAAITTVAPLKVDGWVPVDLPDLRAANDECVRDAQPESVQIVEEGPETVTVESGDTLGKIAKQHERTVEQFLRANGLSDPNMLKIGQVLLIPRENSKELDVPGGPLIRFADLVCVIDTRVMAFGPDGTALNRTGLIQVFARWPRIEGPRESPKVNGRLLGITQGAVQKFLDETTTAIERNGYACLESVEGRCMWLQHQYEVLLATDEVLSLRNTVRRLLPGVAGETSEILTETFNLSTGQPIQVTDLFDPTTEWVEAVSTEAQARLELEPWTDQRRVAGAGSNAANFERFNLTHGGLVLSFAPFSVGGSGTNTLSITIPYPALDGYWAQGGYVARLAQS